MYHFLSIVLKPVEESGDHGRRLLPVVMENLDGIQDLSAEQYGAFTGELRFNDHHRQQIHPVCTVGSVTIM